MRDQIRRLLEQLLEVEVEAFLGRVKGERRAGSEAPPAGYRNGYGKPRWVALLGGTVEVRRPRLREAYARFESSVLPFFKRRPEELGSELLELYLHGLAQGDFELALRHLLGTGAPLSKSSIARLATQWRNSWPLPDITQLHTNCANLAGCGVLLRSKVAQAVQRGDRRCPRYMHDQRWRREGPNKQTIGATQ